MCGPWVTTTMAALTGRWRCTGTAAPGVNSPIPGAGLLRKVRAIAPGNVWAAGTYYNASAQRYQTLVVHFDGTAWTTVVSADAPTADDEIIGLAADPAGSIAHPGGPAGPEPAHRTGELPHGAGLAPRPDTCARSSGAGRSGRRPRAEPTAEHAPADDPDPGDDHRPGVGSGHQRPAGLDLQRGRCRFQRRWLAGYFVARHWHPANLWLNNQERHVQPGRCELFSVHHGPARLPGR